MRVSSSRPVSRIKNKRKRRKQNYHVFARARVLYCGRGPSFFWPHSFPSITEFQHLRSFVLDTLPILRLRRRYHLCLLLLRRRTTSVPLRFASGNLGSNFSFETEKIISPSRIVKSLDVPWDIDAQRPPTCGGKCLSFGQLLSIRHIRQCQCFCLLKSNAVVGAW